MKFLKTAVLLVALMAAPIAFAECDISGTPGLSDVAKAELKVACQQAMLAAEQIAINPLRGVDVSNPEQLSQWGLVAQEWAKALGIAANELGIAVDQFLDTDAGKLTAAVIIWQVAGENIMGFLIGVPLLIIIIVVGLRTARKAKIRKITYSETEKNWRGNPVVAEIQYFGEDETFMFWAAHVATVILSVWTISAVIF